MNRSIGPVQDLDILRLLHTRSTFIVLVQLAALGIRVTRIPSTVVALAPVTRRITVPVARHKLCIARVALAIESLLAAGAAYGIAKSAAGGVDVHTDINSALRRTSRADGNAVGAHIRGGGSALSVNGLLSRGTTDAGSFVINGALRGATTACQASGTEAKSNTLGGCPVDAKGNKSGSVEESHT